ncbi:nuclear transport factor 2 family protein [uncultured Jatrophihabitans sp.]|uniref:nuclear transport factor 2 family protein n=1 Tax=uncultured Jatrophihabitans sp. TaxID=1610747 RepID=UPI0035CC31A7
MTEESTHEQVRQLALRYAEAVDARDLDALMECFVHDVQVGRDQVGRDALRAWFDQVLRTFGVSIHFVGNHRITVLDDDHAEGVVYCRAEHGAPVGDPDGHGWFVMMIQYWDTYERVDGRWYFRRRKEKVWYGVHQEPSPAGELMDRWPGRDPRVAALPGDWPTWQAFWSRA